MIISRPRLYRQPRSTKIRFYLQKIDFLLYIIEFMQIDQINILSLNEDINQITDIIANLSLHDEKTPGSTTFPVIGQSTRTLDFDINKISDIIQKFSINEENNIYVKKYKIVCVCNTCKLLLKDIYFSNTQLYVKKASRRRCKKCIEKSQYYQKIYRTV